MKKKNNIWFYSLIAAGFILILINGCKKDDDDNPTNGRTTAVFNPNITYGSVSDQDGNVYKTITIGTQTWMAENLRTTKYRNGKAIPEVTDNTAWWHLNTGAYCNYKNTRNVDTIATYGRLYNWFSVADNRNIVPTGWHMPTITEWITLIDYLGGVDVAGGKLKELGITHWKNPNIGADNSSGFTALPGGFRDYGGVFYDIGNFGFWWSSTKEDISGNYWMLSLYYPYNRINRNSANAVVGYSVRCVKDN